MDSGRADSRFGFIGLVIGIAGVIVSVVSIFASFQAREAAEEAQLMAAQARLTAVQAGVTIDEAHKSAEQASRLATEAKVVASRNEIIRQVVVSNRRLRSALSNCYEAYREVSYNPVLIAAKLQESCNLNRMANTVTFLSAYNFEGLLESRDPQCVNVYQVASAAIDSAIVEDDYTYLIPLFEQSSDPPEEGAEPVPDITRLLGCLGSLNEQIVNDFYSTLVVLDDQ